LAFVNRVLIEANIQSHFPEVRISVPASVVLGTDIFDEFIDRNDLEDFAIGTDSDDEIVQRFLGSPFPDETLEDLRAFLERADYPLAVRSSGLFEDSPSQPFAGVYDTFMVPNRDGNLEERLGALVTAVKRVYASTFSQRAKAFLRMTPFRLEEEKMAVIIQKIVGKRRESRFYPDFSGVARSHNFYPTPPQKAEDGIAAVALGLGRAVVDGTNCVRFSPRYPKHIVGFSSVDDVLENSQRSFFALDLDVEPDLRFEEGSELTMYGLDIAEKDGALGSLGSTYSPENDVVYDGISRPGVRLVSFAPVLKHEVFPLSELLEVLLDYGSQGTNTPVEIEFAVNLADDPGSTPEFGFLQMRPLSLASEVEELKIGDLMTSQLLCRSASVLGHGRVAGLHDVVVVDYHRFDRLRSREAAQQVTRSCDRRIGLQGHARHPVAGNALLPEPDLLQRGVLHGQSGSRRRVHRLGLADRAAGRRGGRVRASPALRRAAVGRDERQDRRGCDPQTRQRWDRMMHDESKRNAALAAVDLIQPGWVIGVGTGSTANLFIEGLAPVKGKIDGAVASSVASAERLRSLGIRLLDLTVVGRLPIYVDGADEATRRRELIKGGGGALTREKIVAAASERFVCIVDASKLVERLGRFPLPVEVIPMATAYVSERLVEAGGRPVLRDGFTTDNGNRILDVHDLAIEDPAGLEGELNQIAGVVTVGLFCRRPADELIVGTQSGVTRI
jgi:ribose 5-phosphate isomerase